MTDATRQLVSENIGYVHTLASGFSGRGADYDDLVQAGSLVLCELADEYDPTSHPNVSFCQFARLYLIRAFGQEIRASSVIPAACRRSVLPLSAAAEIEARPEPPEGLAFWRAYSTTRRYLPPIERTLLAEWLGIRTKRGPGSRPATVRGLSIRHGISRRAVQRMLDRGIDLLARRMERADEPSGPSAPPARRRRIV